MQIRIPCGSYVINTCDFSSFNNNVELKIPEVKFRQPKYSTVVHVMFSVVSVSLSIYLDSNLGFCFCDLGRSFLCIVEADVYRSNNKKNPNSR